MISAVSVVLDIGVPSGGSWPRWDWTQSCVQSGWWLAPFRRFLLLAIGDVLIHIHVGDILAGGRICLGRNCRQWSGLGAWFWRWFLETLVADTGKVQKLIDRGGHVIL